MLRDCVRALLRARVEVGRSGCCLPLLSTALRSVNGAECNVARGFGASAPASDGVDCEVHGPVGVLTLNRPKVNALSTQMMESVLAQLRAFDADDRVRVMVLTGMGKAFAAGADIKEMSEYTASKAQADSLLWGWHEMEAVRKPVIAAVNGVALGGGCELAMMCDIIIASERAVFGQPEVALGVVPGMGGTQRLVRAVGKSRAMELILTGEKFSAEEALRMGLVSRVVAAESLMETALELARQISRVSLPVAAKAKACVNAAFNNSLSEGLKLEREMFWSCFALEDQKEGMSAFVQQRSPLFQDR